MLLLQCGSKVSEEQVVPFSRNLSLLEKSANKNTLSQTTVTARAQLLQGKGRSVGPDGVGKMKGIYNQEVVNVYIDI